MASALQKETEERRDKLENMVRTNLAVDLASEDLQKSGKDYCIAQSLVG